jgi:hypothetical protein
MNNKMEIILKEEVVAYLSYISGICLEGLRKRQKTSVRIDNVPADIRSENFSRTPPPRYPLPLSASYIDVGDES